MKRISGSRTSTQRWLFLDLVNNPQNYKGSIIYLTQIDEDEIYGVFDKAKKLYFNENGVWFESQFYAI
jgi:hypothetical protein